MNTKQREQFSKFKTLTRWMYEDSKGALDKADARFLVALGLFTYIEILGSFLKGYFRKDSSGQIKKCKRCSGGGCAGCKNGQAKTSAAERFDEFFRYLGQEYTNLIDKHQNIYDKLRCGLVHEIIPKDKFCIYKDFANQASSGLSAVGNGQGSTTVYFIPASIIAPICGIVFSNDDNKWEIILSKLLSDFQVGVEKFVREIENKSALHQNFFETAGQINLENF